MTSTPAPSGQTSSRSAYLVLGMHRSGTSAATQLLALAGARLPDNVMPGDEYNAKGYFEPWRIAVFNDQRMAAGASAWDDVFAHPYREIPGEAAWRARAREMFRLEYGKARFPLLKDPRVSVLMPLWRSVLDAEKLSARCVIPIRHPLAVAGSLARRDGFPQAKSVLLWMTYMLAAEAGSRDLPRAFVDYEALLADWRAEVARLEAAHGAPLPRMTVAAAAEIDRFLTPDLRHNSADGDLRALGEVGTAAQDVFDWFRSAATGASPDRAPLDAALALIAAKRERLNDEAALLATPLTHALQVVGAELAEERSHRRALEERVAGLLHERAQIDAAIDAMIVAP